MRDSITIVAIDGQGRDTDKNVRLLRTVGEQLRCPNLTLLTSDEAARDGEVACRRVPTLDYLSYSRFCIESLHEHIDTEHCLTVQLDGFPLNPERWDDTFLGYDYIGAPWGTRMTRPIAESHRVGNGGLSIRSKRLLEAVAELEWTSDWSSFRMPRRGRDLLGMFDWPYRVPQKHWGNEDAFFCMVHREEMEARGVRFAPPKLASHFAIQPGKRYSRKQRFGTVFGFHGWSIFNDAVAYLHRTGQKMPY